jgi:hypothetical protein
MHTQSGPAHGRAACKGWGRTGTSDGPTRLAVPTARQVAVRLVQAGEVEGQADRPASAAGGFMCMDSDTATPSTVSRGRRFACPLLNHPAKAGRPILLTGRPRGRSLSCISGRLSRHDGPEAAAGYASLAAAGEPNARQAEPAVPCGPAAAVHGAATWGAGGGLCIAGGSCMPGPGWAGSGGMCAAGGGGAMWGGAGGGGLCVTGGTCMPGP